MFVSQQQRRAPALRGSSYGLRVLAQKAARDVSATEHISGVANYWAVASACARSLDESGWSPAGVELRTETYRASAFTSVVLDM